MSDQALIISIDNDSPSTGFRTVSFIRTLAAWAALALFLARTAVADDRASIIDSAPAETCLAIWSSEVAATCEAFRKTALGQTLCGDVFEPLMLELSRNDIASPLRASATFGFEWSDLANVHDPGGFVIFSLADGSPGTAWLFVPRNPAIEIPTCLAAATHFFKQEGYHETALFRGDGRLTRFDPPEAAKFKSPRVLFASPRAYGIANSAAAAEGLLAVKASHSLHGAQVAVQTPSAADESDVANVTFFVKPFELWQLASPSSAAAQDGVNRRNSNDAGQRDIATARRLGLGAVKSVAGRVRFDAEAPCDWSVEATLSVTRPYRAALRVLELRPGPIPAPPDWIASDAITLGRWRWDVPLAMKGIGNLYDEASEPGLDGEGLFEDMLDGLRDDVEGVQVDLRRGVFEQLGPDMLSISQPGPQLSGASAAPRWLYIAAVRNMRELLPSIERFYSDDRRVSHSRLGDYDLWTVKGRASLFVEGESDSVLNVRGLAAGKGQLLFSTDVEMLNQALTDKKPPSALVDQPQAKRMLDWMGHRQDAGTAFQSLVRLDLVLQPSFQAATSRMPSPPAAPKSGDRAEAREALGIRLWRWLLFGTTEARPDLPIAAAPDFELLKQAFTWTATMVSQTSDGWTIRVGVLDRVSPPSP
jgi:hypothetical protein